MLEFCNSSLSCKEVWHAFNGSAYLTARNLFLVTRLPWTNHLRLFLLHTYAVWVWNRWTAVDHRGEWGYRGWERRSRWSRIKEPERGASLGCCQGINSSLQLPRATSTRSSSNCSVLSTSSMRSLTKTSTRTRISAPLRPRVGVQSRVINSTRCDWAQQCRCFSVCPAHQFNYDS